MQGGTQNFVRLEVKDITEHLPLKDFYSPTGPLSRLPGYEFRAQQLEVALTVEKFLRGPGVTLAVEAPTGVGKTFAVLVPALREARQFGTRILFLTAGITLQEQLIGKDLPRLRQLLGFDFTFGLLKGRSNYVCLRLARNAQDLVILDSYVIDVIVPYVRSLASAGKPIEYQKDGRIQIY